MVSLNVSDHGVVNGSSEVEDPAIITVKDFLCMSGVVIPDYQRPYKWTRKNVHQLIDDVIENSKRSAYRLGTIVFHDDGVGHLNVVDGQQRAITLTLLMIALVECAETHKILSVLWPSMPSAFSLSNQSFRHSISHENLRANYQAAKERLQEFDEEVVDALLNRCELVKVVLTDVSTAFQFFDSQNARGKDLKPHDLLKAFHLREMRSEKQEVVLDAVSGWESVPDSVMTELFGDYLFRVRNWSNQKTARQFSKDDVSVFKGVNPDGDTSYPFELIYRVAHYCVNEFNDSPQSRVLRTRMDFPFQLDQIVVNGRRFFEMVSYYNHKRKALLAVLESCEALKPIMSVLGKYEGRNRDGDRYVRNLFDCACFYFWDKFGQTKEFSLVVRQIFYWAYYLRLTYQKMSLSTVDNYASEHGSMMQKIRQAFRPAELLDWRPNAVGKARSTRTAGIEALFRECGLCD